MKCQKQKQKIDANGGDLSVQLRSHLSRSDPNFYDFLSFVISSGLGK